MHKVTRMVRRSDVLSSPWDRDWADTVCLDFRSIEESKLRRHRAYPVRKSNHQGATSRCYLQIAGIWQGFEPYWSNRDQSHLHHLRPFFETPEHKAVSVFLHLK